MSTPIERIIKMLALAEGASTPQEAAAALANAQAVADRFSISAEEIVREQARIAAVNGAPVLSAETHVSAQVVRKTLYTHPTTTKPAWLFELSNTLAYVNDCHIAGRRLPSGYELLIFGSETSIAVVERLFTFIMLQIEDLAAKYRVPRGGAHLKRSYRLGCVAAVQSALMANFEKRSASYGANASTALAVFRSRAEAARANMLAWAGELGAQVREAPSAKSGDPWAFRDGVRDGQTVRSAMPGELGTSSQSQKSSLRALPLGSAG